MNHYGPTETTVGVLTYRHQRGRHRADESDTLPLGRPLGNSQVYLLDSRARPVPIGVSGELHIGGAGLARGYVNRPDQTAASFVPNPCQLGSGSPDVQDRRPRLLSGGWKRRVPRTCGPSSQDPWLPRRVGGDRVGSRTARVCRSSHGAGPRGCSGREASGWLRRSPTWCAGDDRGIAGLRSRAAARIHGAQRDRLAGPAPSESQRESGPWSLAGNNAHRGSGENVPRAATDCDRRKVDGDLVRGPGEPSLWESTTTSSSPAATRFWQCG